MTKTVRDVQPPTPPGVVPQSYPLWVAVLTNEVGETGRMEYSLARDPERVVGWITRFTRAGAFHDLRPVTTERVLFDELFLFFSENPADAQQAAEAEATRLTQAGWI